MRTSAAFSLCAMFVLRGTPGFAQDVWTLGTADFRTEPVTLRAIDAKGVHVATPGATAERVVAADAFLQIDRAAGTPADTPVGTPVGTPPARFMLFLVTGDRVGGVPVKVENDRLTWNNASVGELVVPLTQVAALTRAALTAPGRTPVGTPPTEDVVALSNGDSVRGIVVALAGNTVQVKARGPDEAPVSVPLDSVVSVQFAGAGDPAAPREKKPAYRVRLEDGSSVVATSLTLAGDTLSIAIGGTDARPLALANVSGIEQINGPVSWLTSRSPTEDVQVPFVGTSDASPWKTRFDVDVAGQPFVVGGRSFLRGIGVHSYSRLVYPLDGAYKAFRTRYGISDTLARADVTVRIYVGDKVVHEAKNVKPGLLAPVVVAELGSAKQLVLEVDYGDGIDVEDRLNWLEPALLREIPRPEATPAAPAMRPAGSTRPATKPATRPSTGPSSGPVTQPATGTSTGPTAQPATGASIRPAPKP